MVIPQKCHYCSAVVKNRPCNLHVNLYYKHGENKTKIEPVLLSRGPFYGWSGRLNCPCYVYRVLRLYLRKPYNSATDALILCLGIIRSDWTLKAAQNNHPQHTTTHWMTVKMPSSLSSGSIVDDRSLTWRLFLFFFLSGPFPSVFRWCVLPS